MSGRLNGKHHYPDENTVPRSTYDKLRRKCDALEAQIRSLMFSKSQLEERIAEERQIYAVDRELWRMGKPDSPLTASDSGCLHTAGGEA